MGTMRISKATATWGKGQRATTCNANDILREFTYWVVDGEQGRLVVCEQGQYDRAVEPSAVDVCPTVVAAAGIVRLELRVSVHSISTTATLMNKIINNHKIKYIFY